MKKTLLLAALLLAASPVLAAVTVTTAAASLVAEPIAVKASSGNVGLFSFSLSASAEETLTSVAVQINNQTGSSAAGSDFASLGLYKGTDLASGALVGSIAAVNVGAKTVIPVDSAKNALTATGDKFFVALMTSSTWAAPDAVTVTLPADAILASANSPTITAVTTNVISGDAQVPTLVSAVAKNTGTAGKEAGDLIVLGFSETTNKPVIDKANIASVLTLNNTHSFLDGSGNLGSALWSDDGKVLNIALSNGTSLPTVDVNDTVTLAGSVIKDLAGNVATGSQAITGSFSQTSNDDGDDQEEAPLTACANGLVNGRLYHIASTTGETSTEATATATNGKSSTKIKNKVQAKTSTDQTVYLAAGCRLKPFRGAAVFHARGYKFQNIIELSSTTGITISTKPALPSAGTLVKGTDKTVWFVTDKEKRRGFASEQAFNALGFKFKDVKQITDSDLATMAIDSAIESTSSHPDGTVLKCDNKPDVFTIIGNVRFPFTNAAAFENRGNSWNQIVSVSCGRFHYLIGPAITQ